MFNDSKYTFWYRNLMDRARTRVLSGYVERHHVIPKALGGNDRTDNLVALTAKEHFVAHHLLTKMCVQDSHRLSMGSAFFLMHHHSTASRYYKSRTYELAKKLMAEHRMSFSGDKNPFYGRKHTDETRAKMKHKRIGRICRSDDTIYLFKHQDGRAFTGTQREFYMTYQLRNKGVNSLVRRKTPSYKGWSVEGGKEYVSPTTRAETRNRNMGKSLPVHVSARQMSDGSVRFRVRNPYDPKRYLGNFTTLEEAITVRDRALIMNDR